MVLHAYQSEVTAWVLGQRRRPRRGRILDLGAGTGTGTFALARQATGAEVIAVDMSAEFLAPPLATARRHGLADRVRTVQADLDAGWPDLGPVDLVWASLSLHHMADPDRVLRDVLAALRPGGLLAVVEMRLVPALPARRPRHRPPGARGPLPRRSWPARRGGRSRTWAPTGGAARGRRLHRRGAAALHHRPDRAPLPAGTGRYAQIFLQRVRAWLDDRLAADDLATFDALIDSDSPEGVLRRTDLVVRTARDVWVARRA